ncbi:MAG TPA: Flp family type IVb pilin [Chloroflexota bacterium]
MEVADVEEARESSGKRWATGEEGQGLVEYSLVLLLVAVALAATLGAFGAQLVVAYQGIAAAIP